MEPVINIFNPEANISHMLPATSPCTRMSNAQSVETGINTGTVKPLVEPVDIVSRCQPASPSVESGGNAIRHEPTSVLVDPIYDIGGLQSLAGFGVNANCRQPASSSTQSLEDANKQPVISHVEPAYPSVEPIEEADRRQDQDVSSMMKRQFLQGNVWITPAMGSQLQQQS